MFSPVDELVTHIEKDPATCEGFDSEQDVEQILKGLGYIS